MTRTHQMGVSQFWHRFNAKYYYIIFALDKVVVFTNSLSGGFSDATE